MPKPTKYHGGSYKRTPAGTYRGCLYHNYKAIRATRPTEAAIRVWIDQTRDALHDRLPPLDTYQQRDAIQALALLPDGVTLSAAADFYRRQHQPANITLAEAITQFLEEKSKSNLRPSSMTGLRAHLKNLATDHGTIPLDQTSGPLLIAWLDQKQVHGVTRNNYRASLSNLFRWCNRAQYLKHDPSTAIGRAKRDDTLPAILTVPQTRTLLKSTIEHDPELIPYHALALFAGIRPNEIARLQNKKINLPDRQIHLEAAVTKKRRARDQPILPTLAAWLQAYPPSGPIAPPNLRKRLRHIRAAAKLLPWPQDVMRHSFATYHLTLYKDPGETAAALGHTQDLDTLFRHYRGIANLAQAHEYWDTLPGKLVELVE